MSGSEGLKKKEKKVAIATLKVLWIEFQARIQGKNSIRNTFPSAWLVCLFCVRSVKLQSRKYSKEWLISLVSFRGMLCQEEMPRQNGTVSSNLLKQLVRAPPMGEFTQGLPCSRMKEQIQTVTTEGCDKYGLFFAPGGMLNLHKVEKTA